MVPGNGQALLGMPDIEVLNILTINCNTIGGWKQIELPTAVQTQPPPRIWDVSNTIHTRQKPGRHGRC